MEVVTNILLLVIDSHGILDQQLRLHSIHLLNIIVIIYNIYYFKLFKGGNGPPLVLNNSANTKGAA
jgi:hypothetical protein